MTVDASIPLGFRPQPIDPGAALGNAMTLRQFARMDEQDRIAAEERNRLQALRGITAIGPDGKIDMPATNRRLRNLVTPAEFAQFGHQVQSDQLANQKADAERQKAELEAVSSRHKIMGEILSSLGPNPPLERLNAAIDWAESQGVKGDRSRLPTDQSQVPYFMQEANRASTGIEKWLTNVRAQQKQNFDILGPQSEAGKAEYDLSQYTANGGAYDPTASSDQSMPLRQMVTQPAAPPEGGAVNPYNAAPIVADPDMTAPPVETPARSHLESAARNKAFGTPPDGFRWNANGTDLIEIPGYTSFALQKAERGAPKMTMNADMGKVETSARVESNKNFVEKEYRSTMDQANSARKANSQLAAQSSLAIADKTGWGADAKVAAARVLAAAGFKDAETYAADAQKFYSVMYAHNWEMLNAAKGPQTEGDAERAKMTLQSLGNTPEANAFIRDLSIALNNRTLAKSKFYNQNYDKAMGAGDVSKLERDWQEQADASIFDDPAMKKWAPKAAPQGRVTIKGDDDYNALPSGARFVGPDGVPRRKP